MTGKQVGRETIDIYDANLVHLGTMERGLAHRGGHWHRTFHCWIVSNVNGGSLLFQLRSPETLSFPNLLDVSAAGHLAAGEEVESGLREVTEELGITVEPRSIFYLGERIEAIDESNGDKNREYQSVHLARSDVPLSAYRPAPSEVTGLFWLTIRAGLELFVGAHTEADVRGVVCGATPEEWLPAMRSVTLRDFIPRIQRYYLTVCIMAERLVEGRFPLSIS